MQAVALTMQRLGLASLLGPSCRERDRVLAMIATAAPIGCASHIFLCMLAYYVEWHMREAWRELMFADTQLQAKATRDPVAPAKRSKAALAKVARHTLDDGTSVHSFSTLMAELATIVRNTCRMPSAGSIAPTFQVLTTPNTIQQRAFELLQTIRL